MMRIAEEVEEPNIERRFIFWILFLMAQLVFVFLTFVLTIAPMGHRARLLWIGIELGVLAIPLVIGLWRTKESQNIWLAVGWMLEKAACVLLAAEACFCLIGICQLTWLIVTGKPG